LSVKVFIDELLVHVIQSLIICQQSVLSISGIVWQNSIRTIYNMDNRNPKLEYVFCEFETISLYMFCVVFSFWVFTCFVGCYNLLMKLL